MYVFGSVSFFKGNIERQPLPWPCFLSKISKSLFLKDSSKKI